MSYDRDKYLAVHVETTGMNTNKNASLTDGHDVVVASLVVCDKEFNILDKTTVIIKNHRKDYGQQYHGISREIMDLYGMEEVEAVEHLASFILEHFDPSQHIVCLGQNIHSFTLPFFKKLLYAHEIYLEFSANSIEVFSVMGVLFGPTTIKDLLELYGDEDLLKDPRHVSLAKATTFVDCLKEIRRQWIRLML